jgi:hypothetical protein
VHLSVAVPTTSLGSLPAITPTNSGGGVFPIQLKSGVTVQGEDLVIVVKVCHHSKALGIVSQ